MPMKYFKDTHTALLELSNDEVEEPREISEHVGMDLARRVV